MNAITTRLDDRLNALLIAVGLALVLCADASSLFGAAEAEATAVAVASAVVPAPLV